MGKGRELLKRVPGVAGLARYMRQRANVRRFNEAWAREQERLAALAPDAYANAWGEARRLLWGKYGPVPISPEEAARLRTLRNKYKGHRIFVMGNGPSLNKTPLEKLAGEYTFGVNRIYLMYDRLQWRPSFYTVLDWRVGPDNAPEINALRDGTTFFFPQRSHGLLRTGPDVYWFWSKNRGATLREQFTVDITRGLYGANTITGTAIQIAAHLGFDPIYVIGCDCSYSVPKTVEQAGPDRFGDGVRLYLTSTRDDDPNHFDPRYFGEGKRWHNPNVPAMLEGFESCRRGLEAAGRHICNATVGGQLEALERVDFDSLF